MASTIPELRNPASNGTCAFTTRQAADPAGFVRTTTPRVRTKPAGSAAWRVVNAHVPMDAGLRSSVMVDATSPLAPLPLASSARPEVVSECTGVAKRV